MSHASNVLNSPPPAYSPPAVALDPPPYTSTRTSSPPAPAHPASAPIHIAAPILPLPPSLEPFAPPLIRLLNGVPVPPAEGMIAAVIRMYDDMEDPATNAVAVRWLVEFWAHIPASMQALRPDYLRLLARP